MEVMEAARAANEQGDTGSKRVDQRESEGSGDFRDAANHRVQRALSKDCVRDLFLTLRYTRVERVERGNKLFEAIELGLAERFIRVENIERAAARLGPKPLPDTVSISD
jgi:hypothetical protein